MQRIEPFDPTAATSGDFDLPLPNGGWLVMMNESTVGLLLKFGNGQTRLINPFTLRAMRVTSKQVDCQWLQDYIITGGQAPTGLNITTGECYDPAEWEGGEFIIALPRLVNVGNQTSGGTVANLVNDGQVANTNIIEATASGAPGSNVLVTNDGKVIITVLSNNAQAIAFSITPGSISTPSVVVLHGTADKALSVPATGVTAGAFPAGVTIPGGQVSSAVANANAVPAAGVGAGTLAAGVHLTQIYSDGGDLQSDGNGNLAGVANSAIPTTRNNVAKSAQIYTGASTPTGDGVTSPATGAIWIKK